MSAKTCRTWFQATEGLLWAAARLERVLRQKKDIAPRTSGVALCANNHRQRCDSEQERYILAVDSDTRDMAAFMELLRPVVLTWLEAAVFLHHYCRGLDLGEVAGTVGRHVREVKQARRDLVCKVAVALGYATEEETGVHVEFTRLPLSPEERRRKADELRRKGWKWKRIAEYLGVTTATLWADRKKAL